jgi:hypothetical protein
VSKKKITHEQAIPLTWHPVKVKLRDLKPWDENPRQLTSEQARRIASSIERFGLVQAIAIGPDGEVYDGHQRLTVLKRTAGPDAEIWALQSNRALTDEERRRLVIALHAGATGQWDWDMLERWNRQLVTDEGLDQFYRETLERDCRQLSLWMNLPAQAEQSDEEEVFESEGEAESQPSFSERYVKRITIPIYVPTKREPPTLSECYDRSEVEQLHVAIEADDNLSPEYKAFFKAAAERFTRWHFRNIAELYAHAPDTARVWFERLALVLIDVDQAIECGLASLSKQILDIYDAEYGIDKPGGRR